MINNSSIKDSWLWQQYGQGLGYDPFDRGRYPTMQIALNLLSARQPNGALIVETGCQREPNDIGAGCSTEIFSKYTSCTGGQLISIDNNKEHINRAKEYTKNYQAIAFIENDSIHTLDNFHDSIKENCDPPVCGQWFDRKIDLLYLDSFDYPYGELLNLYGGKTDIQSAIKTLKDMEDIEIIQKHLDIILPSQEHALAEIKAVAPYLDNRSIVLVDDNTLPGGGKSRLAKEWLKEKNWLCLLDYQQTLWIKE